jgi:hypothetical protein
MTTAMGMIQPIDLISDLMITILKDLFALDAESYFMTTGSKECRNRQTVTMKMNSSY